MKGVVLIIGLVGCASRAPVTIAFALTLDGQPFDCVHAASLDGETITLADARLFVYDVRLVDPAGAERSLALTPDGHFQTDRVALLDFEDATHACKNGTPGVHVALTGERRRAGGKTARVKMRIGVPFDANHANPDTSPAPLDEPAMQWSWLSGHTFLRIDARVGDLPVEVHLGSQGCTGSPAHVDHCRWENVAELDLPWTGQPIALDVAPWLRPTLAFSPARCMGDNEDPACAGVLAASSGCRWRTKMKMKARSATFVLLRGRVSCARHAVGTGARAC